MNNNLLVKSHNESDDAYFLRLAINKQEYNLTWSDISMLMETETGEKGTPNKYRKKFKRINNKKIVDNCEEEYYNDDIENVDLKDILYEIKKERVKLTDERIQTNANVRRISREETLIEIAREAVESVRDIIPLSSVSKLKKTKGLKSAILEISDWHYGIEINSFFNQYNIDIARNRINHLLHEVMSYIDEECVDTVYVVNLGDMIAGRIHSQIRVQSRVDTITQIMQVSELISEFLNELSKHYQVVYYDTMDNHSRVEPSKRDSLELESLCRLTSWYLKSRLQDNPNVFIFDNSISDDIITFEVLGHTIAGVHGHKDKPNSVIQKLSMFTQAHYDLILTAHLHHFSCNEENDTLVISNGSLMGTDQFAQDLRLNSVPSQNLIIVSKDNPCEKIIKINLNN